MRPCSKQLSQSEERNIKARDSLQLIPSGKSGFHYLVKPLELQELQVYREYAPEDQQPTLPFCGFSLY